MQGKHIGLLPLGLRGTDFLHLLNLLANVKYGFLFSNTACKHVPVHDAPVNHAVEHVLGFFGLRLREAAFFQLSYDHCKELLDLGKTVLLLVFLSFA